MPGTSAESEETAARIRAALTELLDLRGYDEIELVDVLTTAGVDEATFAAHFVDLDACFLEVWQRVEGEFLGATSGPLTLAEEWRDGLRGAAWATARFMQEDHSRARILMFKLEVGGEEVRARRDQLIHLYTELVHAGRLGMDDPEAMPRDIAVGIANMIWERLNDRVWADEFAQMPGDVPDLLFMTFLPYLGREVAGQELARGREELGRDEGN